MRVRDASSYYCGEANPVPHTIVGRDMGGQKATVTADRPCLKPPRHDGNHRDVEGREWCA